MSLQEMMFVTSFLFFIGVSGIALNRNNFIIVLMSLELMLLAVNLNFMVFSMQFDDMIGQIFVLFVLSIAATESAIGLSIICTYTDVKNNIML
jgi:NADH-quinone oxidoreductase subunit K